MEIIIPIEQVIVDIEPRVHNDDEELIKSIKAHGQIEPITVEGPDAENSYYLINGYRRLEAMKKFTEEFPQVKCFVIRELTTQSERNKLRFMTVSPCKKATKYEHQTLYESVKDDDSVLNTLPGYKIRKIEKGRDIPDEERNAVAKKRASQEALWVIHHLDCNESYKKELKLRLYDRKITTDHATALKKLTKNKLYWRLNRNLKPDAIEKALKQAKFTDDDAKLILIGEIMKSRPHPELADIWAQYFCDELEEKLQIMNPVMEGMISEDVKQRIRSLIMYYLGWLWSRPDNKENSTEEDIKNKRDALFDTFVSSRKKGRTPRMEVEGNTLRILFEKADEIL